MVDAMPISRHPIYYIPSGDVVFLIGGRLFRVHRYFFVRDSVKFRNMLSVDAEAAPLGSSDAQAILFVDISAEEFENFLWVFYNDQYDHYEAPVEKWIAILRLAHMWQFPGVKALATRKLSEFDIDPVDKAVMARDYEVEPAFGWQEQAYAAIGEREEPISDTEGEKLGVHMLVALANLRERIREEKHERDRKTWCQNETQIHDHDSTLIEDLEQAPDPAPDPDEQLQAKSPLAPLSDAPASPEPADEPSPPPGEIWEVLENHSVAQEAAGAHVIHATPVSTSPEAAVTEVVRAAVADVEHSELTAHLKYEDRDAEGIHGGKKKKGKKGKK